MVLEQGLGVLRVKRGVCNVLLQQSGRLRPERTDTLAAAFAEKLYAVGSAQPQVRRLERDNFLNARPCVEPQLNIFEDST
jgi:hypothetical protein